MLRNGDAQVVVMLTTISGINGSRLRSYGEIGVVLGLYCSRATKNVKTWFSLAKKLLVPHH